MDCYWFSFQAYSRVAVYRMRPANPLANPFQASISTRVPYGLT